MAHIWDYDINKLKKTKNGRLLILERMINYGVYMGDKEKIDLGQVKKNWDKLHIDADRKQFLQFMIWGK